MMWNITDKKVLVTGGSSGIGLAAATALAQQGACVTITSRDAGRAESAIRSIKDISGVGVDAELLDLSSLESVRRFSDRYNARVDHTAVLINNAGNVFSSRRETVDGNELTFGTNHLGPFLLTSLLSENLARSGTSRIINTSSIAHANAKEGMLFDDLQWKQRRYKMMDVYGHSKLANILHARGINSRSGPMVRAFAVHPGLVSTSFGGRGGSVVVRAVTKFGSPWMRSPQEGADTLVWLATEPDIDSADGIYFSDRRLERTSRFAKDDEQADRLWQASEALVGVAQN